MNRDESARRTAPGALLTAAAAVIVIAGLKAAAPLIVPFLLALFLALLSLPFLQWLEGRGAPSALAVVLTILADVVVLAAFGFLVSGAVAEFADTAPFYLEQLFDIVVRNLERLEAQGIVLSEWISEEGLQPEAAIDLLGGVLSGTLKGAVLFLSYSTLVVLTLVFLLFEAMGFRAKLEAALGHAVEPRRLTRMTREIQQYLAIKTAISALTGVLVGVWVAILGVDFPLLWGLLAFVLNYIPNIGSIIAAVPAALIAWVQFDLAQASLVALGYLVINMALGNLLEPHLMGRRFGLSTLVVFLSLVFWGWVWGPVGMLLSVPLTMVGKIALEHSPRHRWIAMLLGPSGVAPADAVPPVAAPAEEREARSAPAP